jgi:hypothetical protein
VRASASGTSEHAPASASASGASEVPARTSGARNLVQEPVASVLTCQRAFDAADMICAAIQLQHAYEDGDDIGGDRIDMVQITQKFLI